MGNQGAQLGLTLGGGVIGLIASFGNPAGFAIGAAAGGIVGGLLFPIDDPQQARKGPQLNDLAIQLSTYGTAIPTVYGTVRIAGNVIWAGPLIREKKPDAGSKKGGKKGGGKKPFGGGGQDEYTYKISVAIAIARGPIIGIRRVWADDQLVFDFEHPTTGVVVPFTVYLGSETQTADPVIQAVKGVADTPAYRGLAYVVFQNFDIGSTGGRLPNFQFEIVAGGAQEALVDIYTPTGGILWGGKIAIDYETGLVWTTSLREGVVRVFNPDTFEIVKEITGLLQPRGIAYCPPFIAIEGFPPEAVVVPPRMWVASALPPILGGSIYSIQTHDYAVAQGSVGYAFYDYGEIATDIPAIIHLNPLIGVNAVVFLSNGVGTNGYVIKMTASDGGFGNPAGQDSSNAFSPVTAVNEATTADVMWYEAGQCFYHLNWLGTITRLKNTGQASPIIAYAASGSIRPILELFDVESQQITVDQQEGKVYVTGQTWSTRQSRLAKVNADLTAIEWIVDGPTFGADSILGVQWHPINGNVYVLLRKSGVLWVRTINKATGATLFEFATDLVVGINFCSDFQVYPVALFAFATLWAGSSILKVPLVPFPNPIGPSVGAVVQDLCIQGGLDATDIDVTSLASSTVRGYVIAHRTPIRNAVEPLTRAFQFDAFESDYKIKFQRRGLQTPTIVPSTALGAVGERASRMDPLPYRRTEQRELPRQIDVRYLDVDDSYKVSVQSARRLLGPSEQLVSVELPFSMTSTEARQLSEALLYGAWNDRVSITITLSMKYAYLDPGDVITITQPELLPLLDDFNRPNEATPPKNWVVALGTGLKLVGQAVESNSTAADQAIVWTHALDYVNQEVEVILGSAPTNDVSGSGLAVRLQGKVDWGSDHYEVTWGNTTGPFQGYLHIKKRLAGITSTLVSNTTLTAFGAGDRVRIRIHFTMLTAYVNDVLKLTVVDTAVATGNYVGLAAYTGEAGSYAAVNVGGQRNVKSKSYRVVKTTLVPPNQIELQAVEEDASVYTGIGTGVARDIEPEETIHLIPTVLYLLDIPQLEVDHDTVGIYAGMSGGFEGWLGGTLYRSTDGKIYEKVGAAQDEATAGGATSTLTWEGEIL